MTVWLNTVSRPEGRSRRRKKGRASNTRAREKEMGEKSKTRLVYVRFMRPDLVSARLLYIYIYTRCASTSMPSMSFFLSLVPCHSSLFYLSLSLSLSPSVEAHLCPPFALYARVLSCLVYIHLRYVALPLNTISVFRNDFRWMPPKRRRETSTRRGRRERDRATSPFAPIDPRYLETFFSPLFLFLFFFLPRFGERFPCDR